MGMEAPRSRFYALARTVKHEASPYLATLLLVACLGCNLCPTKWERERVHNPFPQLQRVAVLPFFNQSGEPTVDTALVAEKYYGALQAIPGFEVLPVGVSKVQWQQFSQQRGEPTNGEQFQELARYMGVDALVVGSVTDFDAYYPPRMAMTVHWYAANEGFFPIPAGYGLPWGTENEKQIPDRITQEAEFALARSQLATQTPIVRPPSQASTENRLSPVAGTVHLNEAAGPRATNVATGSSWQQGLGVGVEFPEGAIQIAELEAAMPADWPDPTDLIPDPPSPVRPVAMVNHEPVLSQTRMYRGDDPDFTVRLAQYVETSDDARPASWQGYLKRSDDFIHFCCHLHIMEMLESRGGRDQSDLILRWPLSRY